MLQEGFTTAAAEYPARWAFEAIGIFAIALCAPFWRGRHSGVSRFEPCGNSIWIEVRYAAVSHRRTGELADTVSDGSSRTLAIAGRFYLLRRDGNAHTWSLLPVFDACCTWSIPGGLCNVRLCDSLAESLANRTVTYYQRNGFPASRNLWISVYIHRPRPMQM